MRWDIFCRVIDNYGDAGVCWRLAMDLSRRGERVTLYIDEPDLLVQLCDPEASSAPVCIRAWPKEDSVCAPTDIADVVIEAFACDPPPSYVAAMAAQAGHGQQPVWINLEYLSAEGWIGEYHLLPSPHPHYPLVKHFYFPGFTPDSGGLLRESEAVQQHANDQQAMASEIRQALRIFLFCYEQPTLEGWLNTLNGTVLTVAPCPATRQLHANPSELPPTLTIRHMPFVPQSAFDAVLRKHDLLFVRGEDSFVRAQWASKPLFWHIYPQVDDAHLVKLRAFYDRYLDSDLLTQAQCETFMGFILAWNGSGDSANCARLWPQILLMLPALQQNALHWREKLLKQPDMVTQLQAFVADLVK